MNQLPLPFQAHYAKDRGAQVWHSLEGTRTQLQIVADELRLRPLQTVCELEISTGLKINVLSRVLSTMKQGKRIFDDTDGKRCPISGKDVTAWKINAEINRG